MKKKRRWPVIASVIAALFVLGMAGNIFMLSQHTKGTIELPNSLPSAEMMVHIAANLEQLSGDNGPFSHSADFGIVTALDYADDNGLTIMLTLEADASPEEVLAAEPQWQGQYLVVSDLMAAITGSGRYTLLFVCSQGPLVLAITQNDAASISTAPLEEAMALIQSVIGTP